LKNKWSYYEQFLMYQASREARELKEFEASRHLVYINAPPNQESLTALLGILKI
jgi:hypothetical protein